MKNVKCEKRTLRRLFRKVLSVRRGARGSLLRRLYSKSSKRDSKSRHGGGGYWKIVAEGEGEKGRNGWQGTGLWESYKRLGPTGWFEFKRVDGISAAFF